MIWNLFAPSLLLTYSIVMRLHQGYLLSVRERWTTQRDPTAMGAYALSILPLIKFLFEFINLNKKNSKKVVFVDGFSVAGSLKNFKDYWDKLTAVGPKCGYFPKPTKSYLIIKEEKLMEAQNLFANSRENITDEGKRHLDAVIGSTEYRDWYLKYLVKAWDNQLTILSTIPEIQPQVAYLTFRL